MGRLLIGTGIALVIAGAAVMLGERAGIRWMRLPGDIVVRGRNGSFYFPVVTCLLLSILISVISWILNRR